MTFRTTSEFEASTVVTAEAAQMALDAAIKAPRFIVQRGDLATAQAAVERFISSGIEELKSKLGPIVWHLAPTKHFDAKELVKLAIGAQTLCSWR